jgi:hypothetical protein
MRKVKFSSETTNQKKDDERVQVERYCICWLEQCSKPPFHCTGWLRTSFPPLDGNNPQDIGWWSRWCSPLSSTKRDFDNFERCWTLLNWIQLAPEMAYREWTGRTLGGSGDIDIFRFRTQIIAWKLPPSERETLIKPEASIMWGATTSKGISLKDAIWSGNTSGFKNVCKTTALLAKLPSFFPLKTLVITSNHISLGWLREVLDETMCFTPQIGGILQIKPLQPNSGNNILGVLLSRTS